MNIARFYTLISLLCLLITTVNAQHSRFRAGVVAGLNFAQLEGDELTDYFGLNAGLIGTARVARHTQIGVEFLFSQNGEYVLPSDYPQVDYGPIWLNHIEIPVHVDWLIGVFQRDKFYDLNLNIGTAYTRLMGFKAKDSEGVDVTDQIKYTDKDAFLLQAGMMYHFADKIALNLKASLPVRVEGLSWTVGVRGVYMI